MGLTPASDALKQIIEEVIASHPYHGVQLKLADDLGMTGPALGRVRRGMYPLGAENCLRLAEVSGRSASEILKAAGKEELVRLIELQFGAEHAVSKQDRRLLTVWHGLTDTARTAVIRLLDLLPTERKRRPATKVG